MRNRFDYYNKLNDRVRQPIFTICMLGRKIYVVTKAELISRADRKHKSISYAPIVSEFCSITCGTSNEATKILNHNLLGEHGNWGLCEEMVSGIRAALKPGKDLDNISLAMAQEVSCLLDAIKPDPGQGYSTIQLSAWVKQIVTVATTNSVYGPHNPYKSQEIKDAFWEFEGGLMLMLAAPFPSYTARKHILARDKVTKALEKYFAERHFDHGSKVAKARFDTSVRNKVALPDIGRFEIGGTVAILTNTYPAVYWTLLLVYVAPGLLADLRAEIDAALIIDPLKNNITIDITVMKSRCPLLLSTLKESLRYRGMGVAVREVVEDTELGGYLLKKGAMLQVPIQVVHSDQACWGEDAKSFNPRRFLKDDTVNGCCRLHSTATRPHKSHRPILS
ncbi:conserved hypothetical protein [Uncinocarpus reesii 1704]|uniref:Cytochrome P450 n=1 Tax=Uncinocarpus reesii (strain UAMH 1704) TaxID=336963 RepID=C4JV27_UNCRE|nr:uncharacterized protein UREG_04980 [Uncinocarpus reesii 1704]EEP80138.1 conserved hypothetical protein [Uncinocarpus reesii 1704]